MKSISVTLTSLDLIHPLRELYRREMNCQIVLDSWAGRGWVDGYLLQLDDHTVGYGLVGGVRREPMETVTEFFVLPPFRGLALSLFRQFIEVSGATNIEVQTNDILLTLMLYDTTENIESNVILFHDALTTNLQITDAAFRRISADDKSIFAHNVEPEGEFGIEHQGQIVATGGILFHYNVPYGDLFMEVAEPYRKRGYGSYLIQELKRVAYEIGKVPAARCNAKNLGSRGTLQKAGMLPCARVLTGTIKR